MSPEDPTLHDLAAPYALDALGAGERASFEEHLAGCSECREVVDAFHDSAAAIALGTADAPPPHMRERVLAAVEDTPQDRSVVALGTRRRPGIATRLLIAAAALVVLVAGIAVMASIGGDGPSAEDVLAAPDLVNVELAATDAYAGPPPLATISYSPGERAAVVTFAGLLPAGTDQTYELWVVDGSTPSPAGLFEPGDDGRAQTVLDARVAADAVIAVTLEPAGGSDQPTGEILFAGAVGS